MERLRQEILDTVGPTSRPTFEDIRGMKYLRAVINGEPFCHISCLRNLQCLRRDTPLIPYCTLQRPVSSTIKIIRQQIYQPDSASVHATTWPNPDPNGKPFYIPAGTRCVDSRLS